MDFQLDPNIDFGGIIDEILNTDPSSISGEMVLSKILGKNYTFAGDENNDNKLFESQKNELRSSFEEMIESLKPKKLSVPIEDIENLSCKYSGDELYSEVLKLIYSKRVPGKIWKPYKYSEEIENEISSDSVDSLYSIREEIFDNLDPYLFGKPINYNSKKKRSINFLGIRIDFDVIMSLGRPVYFSISPIDSSVEEAVNGIKGILNSNRSSSKPCENSINNIQDPLLLSQSINSDINGISPLFNTSFESRINSLESIEREYDKSSRDFVINEPPLINELDCDPKYPQDYLTGEPLFNIDDLVEIKREICEEPGNIKNPDLPIEDDPSLPDLEAISEIDQCIEDAFSVYESIKDDIDSLKRFTKIESQLEEIYIHYRIVFSYFDNLFSAMQTQTNQTLVNIGQTDPTIEYLRELNKFSVRFKGTSYNSSTLDQVKFKFTYPTFIENEITYKEIENSEIPSFSGKKSTGGLKKSVVDSDNIRIGQEYKYDGVLYGRDSKYLRGTGEDFRFDHINSGEKDIANFYEFISDVILTNKSKSTIINQIRSRRGTLYGNLIEVSSLPWLFFSQEERGDNDARDPSKIRPSSLDKEGSPNQTFLDFWSNYKTKWDEKYNDILSNFIENEITRILELGKKAAYKNSIKLSLVSGSAERISNIRSSLLVSINNLQETILYVTEKIQSIKSGIDPIGITSRFSKIPCIQNSSINIENPDVALASFPRVKTECPPECCGPSGSDFNLSDYLNRIPVTSDCPTIYQKCWWKEFSKKATLIGLLPYPNGIPPVEDPKFFLVPGPSVRFGLRYWPVGYLPPSFIPIAPLINPVDGQPFIRIPLPMIWNIVDPIVIPLPFNLGILSIFIPFIGGFMPSPLIYLRENLFGNSLFLAGLRGLRFIPRKSDKKINDPKQPIKEKLAYGIPNNIFPLEQFSDDYIDFPKTIIGEIRTNLNKIMDRTGDLENIGEIREAQELERSTKQRIRESIKKYKKEYPLYEDVDLPQPDITEGERNNIIALRKRTLSESIRNFIELKLTKPRDIRFPKNKDNLKFDTPNILRIKKNIDDISRDLTDLESPKFLNIREEMRSILREIKIETPQEYASTNSVLTNTNSILMIYPGDPDLMTDNEFKNFSYTIKKEMVKLCHRILRGDGSSINRKIRDGAFSELFLSELEGEYLFPESKITDLPPGVLKFIKNKNPLTEGIYIRIMSGLGASPIYKDELREFIRNDGEKDQIVIRVKDIKRILSKKIGLGRSIQNDPESVRNALMSPTSPNIQSALINRSTGKSIIDREEPLISKFPIPSGNFSNMKKISNGFGRAFSSFSFPPQFPPKQDQESQTLLAGGIPQIVIPGEAVKEFIKRGVGQVIDNGIDRYFPEINDINSDRFVNMNSQDITKMSRNIVNDLIDEKGNIPDFLNVTDSPIFPKSRPTDISELALISLGAPPQSRIPMNLLWKYWKGVAKTPVGSKITYPLVVAASKLLSSIPWPIVSLIGRGTLDILSPIPLRDDLPAWSRLSLKNAYFVAYMDEFLRSAADISGLYKFCLGTDLTYPIQEIKTEILSGFDPKKF